MAEKSTKTEKKEEKEKPEKGTKSKKKDENFVHKVRIAGVILDGNKNINSALMSVKGISQRVSRSAIRILNVPENTKLGTLNEAQIGEIENIIQNLDKHLPAWMLNRRDDYYTGGNLHIIGSDIDMATREDITREKKTKSYRGVRHSLNLPVRGQRTRSSFRHGATVGVSRKKQLQLKKKEKKK